MRLGRSESENDVSAHGSALVFPCIWIMQERLGRSESENDVFVLALRSPFTTFVPMKVIKIGGNVIDDPQALARFEADFARMPGEKVLVHGGGKLATALSKTLGIETRMVAGRRVTDRQTLDVVTMVYAGLINKNVVAALQAQGCNAIGMSGADAGAILSHRRTTGEVDYGFVGDVDRVDAEGILALSRAGFTPVFCAITHDGQGSLLNTNADTVASEIAKALAARVETELVFCFEKPGVLSDPEDDTSVIARIDAAAFERLRAEGTVSGGMLPKLENAFAALRCGVKKVIIASPAFVASPQVPHTEIVP